MESRLHVKCVVGYINISNLRFPALISDTNLTASDRGALYTPEPIYLIRSDRS